MPTWRTTQSREVVDLELVYACLTRLIQLGQTSLFSCAEPNVNEEKSLF